MTLEMTLGEKLEIFRKVQANPDISTYKWTRICAYDKDSNNNDSMTTQDLDLTEGVKIIYSEYSDVFVEQITNRVLITTYGTCIQMSILIHVNRLRSSQPYHT